MNVMQRKTNLGWVFFLLLVAFFLFYQLTMFSTGSLLRSKKTTNINKTGARDQEIVAIMETCSPFYDLHNLG